MGSKNKHKKPPAAPEPAPSVLGFPWPGRLPVARVLLGLGLVFGMIISLRLWLTERSFPHLPCFDWLPPTPAPLDGILLAILLVSLLLYLLKPHFTWALGVTLGLSLLFALQDQVRWQPWFYLYLLGLAGFLLVKPSAGKPEQGALLGILQFMLVAMYFWSGYHKFGPGFRNLFDSAFVEALRDLWPGWLHGLLSFSRDTVAWIEILTAIALLIPITRKLGVLLAVSTHLFILLLVGPFGTASNYVIWPWNLAMALLVPVVFWGAPMAWPEMFRTRLRSVAIPVIILLGVMPAFSPGKWDRYLSFHLYSGHEQRLMLVLHERFVSSLPESYRPHLTIPAHAPSLRELNLRNWSYAELNVPFPSEERMNLAVAKDLAALPLPNSPVVFFYFDYEYLLKERGWDRFTPKEMLDLKRFPNPPLRYGNPGAK